MQRLLLADHEGAVDLLSIWVSSGEKECKILCNMQKNSDSYLACASLIRTFTLNLIHSIVSNDYGSGQ